MIGWIANVAIMASWYFTGEKNRIGFILLGAGEAYYVTLGVQQGQWQLAFISLVCCLVAAYNWYKWGRKQ